MCWWGRINDAGLKLLLLQVTISECLCQQMVIMLAENMLQISIKNDSSNLNEDIL